MRSRLRGGLLLACGLLLALTATACGIPTDDEPRPLADETPSSEAVEPVPEDGDAAATVYLVSDDRLQSSERAIEGSETPEAVLDVLLLPTGEEEQSEGLQTLIPQGTEVLSVTDDGDGVWVVNMSADWGTLVSPADLRAYGQVVLTLTELPEVEAVRFEVDGVPVDTPPTVNEEASPIVRASDYAELKAPPADEDPN